jgi:hypothetical protein
VQATDLFRNWNYMATDGAEYKKRVEEIDEFIATKGRSDEKVLR